MRYDRQRPTRSVTIGFLVMLLRQEMFLPATQICFAVGKGIKRTLLNGYHRLTALAKYGGSMKFTETVYRCKNMQAVNNLYTFFDVGLGKRTPGDMYAAHVGAEEVGRIGRKHIRRLLGAVRFIADMFSQSVAKVQTHFTLLYCVVADHFIHPMGDLLKLLAGDTHGLSEQSILQQPVLAVALVTLRYCPKKAREFWDTVAHNGVVLTTDPRSVFRTLLLKLEERSDRKANGQRNKPTPRMMAYFAAYCWNQYYKGETMLGLDEYTTEKRPKITIAGTPFSANTSSTRLKQALVDLGFCEDHLEHVNEAVKLSATHYDTKRKPAKKKAKARTETVVSASASVVVRSKKVS
jgi:hypothetical protein